MAYYKTKAAYQKRQEDGNMKKETQNFLVDAMSVTEAEATVIQELGSVQDLHVSIASESNISEVIEQRYENANWYLVKWEFTDTNDETGKESTVKNTMLVSGVSTSNADTQAMEKIGDLNCVEITGVNKSNFADVLTYGEVKQTPHAIERREAKEGNVVLDTPNLKITIEDDNGQLGEPWTSSFAIPDVNMMDDDRPETLAELTGEEE